MKKLHNRKYLEPYRKTLRANLTPAEAVLWKAIQHKQLKGRKFRRQHSIGNYILDFYCPQEKLCIELDGCSHFTHAGYEQDVERTEYLNSQDIRVIRFENNAIFNHIESVLESISSKFKT